MMYLHQPTHFGFYRLFFTDSVKRKTIWVKKFNAKIFTLFSICYLTTLLSIQLGGGNSVLSLLFKSSNNSIPIFWTFFVTGIIVLQSASYVSPGRRINRISSMMGFGWWMFAAILVAQHRLFYLALFYAMLSLSQVWTYLKMRFR